MLSNFGIPFGASVLAAAVTCIGIFTIRRFEHWGRRNTTYFICFAAGVLIAVSFLHIVPQAFTMSPQAPFFLLAGFLILHFLNWMVITFVCHRDPTLQISIGLIPMLGIGLHSFIDGIIYSVTFSVSIFTGTLAAVGMVLHEFPEGIITYLLLLKAGFSHRRSLILAFLAAAFSTPLGTLISFPFIHHIDTPDLGALLALSAGALIYAGASHLLPQAEKEHKKYSLITLGAGILTALGILFTHH